MKMVNKGILPLSVGGGAALFSIITGLISGVSPGMMLIRGFLSALAGFCFIFFAGWLIKTYLPELGQFNENKPSDGSQEENMGNHINIIMQDDIPEEGMSENDGTMMSGSDSNELSGNRDQNEIAETAEKVHNNKPEDSDIGSAEDNGLDELPNLDSLEISMGSSSEEMQSSDNFESAEPEPVKSKRPGAINPSEHGDPSDIAKAVKTVLARDKQK